MIGEKKLVEDLIHCDALGRKSFQAVIDVVNKQPKVGECENIKIDILLPDGHIIAECVRDSVKKRNGYMFNRDSDGFRSREQEMEIHKYLLSLNTL